MLHLLIHLKIRCPRDLLACRLFIAVAFWLIDRPISNPQVSSYTFIGFLCGSVRLRWHRSYPCPSWLVLAGISYRSRPSFSRCNSNVILYYTSICFWTRVAYSTYFLRDMKAGGWVNVPSFGKAPVYGIMKQARIFSIGINQISSNAASFKLSQNYPNPFNTPGIIGRYE